MPSDPMFVTNSTACFQPVARLSILNISPAETVISDDALRRKAAKQAQDCDDPLDSIRLQCLAKGIGTAKKLARHFFSSKKEALGLDEFVQILKNFMAFSVSEPNAIRIFEQLTVRHGNPPLALGKIVDELRPPMNAQRRALVEQIFRKMDPNRTGYAPVTALVCQFDHRRQTQFESGTMSREEVVAQFLASFEPEPDGQVMEAEFVAFYAAKSAAVHSDIHFDWVLRNQWKL